MDSRSTSKPKPKGRVHTRKEESSGSYGFGGYCPLEAHEILKDRYVVIRKTGFGIFSTVWLAYDLERGSHCALKVVRASATFTEAAREEIVILKHISRVAKESTHPGKDFLIRLRDHFRHSSPNGTHVVLVQEILGESLRSFLDHNEALPLPVIKHLARELLQSVDFLHSQCRMINTDMKPANLLVDLKDPEAVIREDPMLFKLSSEAIEHAKRLRSSSPSHALPLNSAIQKGIHRRSSSASKSFTPQIVRSMPIASPPMAYRVRFDAHAPAPSRTVSPEPSPSPSSCSYTSPTSSKCSKSADSQFSPATSPEEINSGMGAMKLLDEEEIQPFSGPGSSGAPSSLLDLPAFTSRTSASRPKDSDGIVEWEESPFTVKMCDFGNATSIDVHTWYDIQTLEYRAPEVFLGKDWNENVDIWSLGCILFEAATGDILFSPTASAGPVPSFRKEDDMIAQIQELTGTEFPPEFMDRAPYASRYFNSKGKMKRIKKLSMWPLQDVLVEKYLFDPADAARFGAFLNRMLTVDKDKRPSAQELIDDPFLATSNQPQRSAMLQRTLSTASFSSSSRCDPTPDLRASALCERSSCSSPVIALVNATGLFETGLAEQCAGPWDASLAAPNPRIRTDSNESGASTFIS